MSQEATMMEKFTNPELSDKVNFKNTSFDLYVNIEPEAVIAKSTAPAGVEPIESEVMKAFAPEVISEVLKTEVSFFAKSTEKYESTSE